MKTEDNKMLHAAADEAIDNFIRQYNALDECLLALDRTRRELENQKAVLDQAYSEMIKAGIAVVNADAVNNHNKRRENYYAKNYR